MIKVLFVDDEPNILDGFRRMVRLCNPKQGSGGIDAKFAASAEEALQIMETDPVAVVVTDMAMPGRDGYALVCELYDRYPNVVPIVVSGQWDNSKAEQKLGPSVQFLTKPVSFEKLIQAISLAGFEVSLMDMAHAETHRHDS